MLHSQRSIVACLKDREIGLNFCEKNRITYEIEVYRSDLSRYVREMRESDCIARLVSFSPHCLWVVGEVQALKNHLPEYPETTLVIMRVTNNTLIPVFLTRNKEVSYARTYFTENELNLVVVFSLKRDAFGVAKTRGSHSTTAQLDIFIPRLGISLRFSLNVCMVARLSGEQRHNKNHIFMDENSFAIDTGVHIIVFQFYNKWKGTKIFSKKALFIRKNGARCGDNQAGPLVFQARLGSSSKKEYSFTDDPDQAVQVISHYVLDPCVPVRRALSEHIKTSTFPSEFKQVKQIIDHETDVISINDNQLEIFISFVAELYDENSISTFLNYNAVIMWDCVTGKTETSGLAYSGLVTLQRVRSYTWYQFTDPAPCSNFVDNGSGKYDEFDDDACSTISSERGGFVIKYFDNRGPQRCGTVLEDKMVQNS